jgi:hypothetical protein
MTSLHPGAGLEGCVMDHGIDADDIVRYDGQDWLVDHVDGTILWLSGVEVRDHAVHGDESRTCQAEVSAVRWHGLCLDRAHQAPRSRPMSK